MNIRFMLSNIKDSKTIYKEIPKEDSVLFIKYDGVDYCKDIVEKILPSFPEINSYEYYHSYKPGECFGIMMTNKGQYILIFTIDTFHNVTQLTIDIDSSLKEYDIFLEKLKVRLKEILLKDWEVCTWIIDEQSEYLGMQLYPLIFKTENKMRAFINKVLTHKLGVKWMDFIGFEDIIKGYKRSSPDFKREIPEFNNINTFLMCCTVESLAKLMFKSKIFENDIVLSSQDSANIHQKLSDNKVNAIADLLRKVRTIKVDVWKDIFQKYFNQNIKENITIFIKNRNHIAHNKILTLASYNKMKQNILDVEESFDKADKLFIVDEPSEELYELWNQERIEQELMEREVEYIYDTINDETDIKVLLSKEIFSLFEEKLYDLHMKIEDSLYFYYGVEVSQLNTIQNDNTNQLLFSINSHVHERFSFNIYTMITINEGLGMESYLHLWAEGSDNTKFLETQIVYRNGNAYEDFENESLHYIAISNSCFDEKTLQTFIKDVIDYTNEEMNALKSEADTLSTTVMTEGTESPVADFPCWNCGEEYVSINSDIYPYGKCINCGEENEIRTCCKRGIQGSEEDIVEYCGGYFCHHCLKEIEE